MLEKYYTEAHKNNDFKGVSVAHYCNMLRPFFSYYGVNTTLDYGSGPGYAWKKGMAAYVQTNVDLYDPYIEELSTLSDKTYDAVVCIDVVEHIPEEHIDEALTNIFSRANKFVMITFCNRDAKKTLPDGTNVHVLQRPRFWWEQKIKEVNTKEIPTVLVETH